MDKTSSPVGFFTQLGAMLSRNVLLKFREKRKTAAEILLPLYFLLILVIIKLLLPYPNYPPLPEESGKSFMLGELYFENFNGVEHTIYVTPNTTETRQFVDEMKVTWKQLVLFPPNVTELNVTFIESEEKLLELYSGGSAKNVFLAVILEPNPFQSWNYTIRNNPENVPLPLPNSLFADGSSCRSSSLFNNTKYLEIGYTCPVNHYYYSNFLAVQTILESTWLRLNVTDYVMPNYIRGLQLQVFPKPSYIDDVSMSVLRFLVPFYMVLTLSQFITYLLMVIVGEKEKKIKEGLRMMGLRDSVYWLSWLLIYLVFVAFLSAVATIVLYAVRVLQHSNAGLVFLLFFLYGVSILALAFLITPFFDKARVAGIFGALVVTFLNLLYYIQVTLGDSVGVWAYWLLSLISPTGFALAMDKLLVLDINTNYGVTDTSLWDGPGMPFAGSLIMISVDIVLYILLAYYLDSVLPSEYGAKRRPWFCFTPSFWCGSSKASAGYDNLAMDISAEADEKNDVETVPSSFRGKEAIRIRGLSKTFKPFGKPSVPAVKSLNLDVYEGQITAILGHNGAGKTTLFNMLTGMTAPSGGHAYIYGKSIRNSDERREIRQQTGICPQHDVLFDLLTPREHLAFFAKLRGINEEKIPDEVEKTLRDIDLVNKGDNPSSKLSGGQKRKLSIGIALIGDPKIVFLDEPTAGVDPYSRRHLWSLLQQRKEGKVILLTTHFMDEADLLADRKAIVSKGQLRCCGSSLFLKNKFGVGYHLTFVLDENFNNISVLRDLVQSHVTEAKLNRHYGRELSFVLPTSQVHLFPALFSKLETCLKEGQEAGKSMGFTSFGVSMTTLEEVFLKLGEDADAETEASLSNGIDQKPSTTYKEDLSERLNAISEELRSLELSEVRPSRGRALRSLLRVRGLNMLRDPMAVFFQVLLPVAFAALGLWLATLQNLESDQVRRALTIDMYAEQVNEPLLFHNDADGGILNVIESLASTLNVSKESYTGAFSDLLDLDDADRQITPYWAALNADSFNLSLPSLDLSYFIMRYNDTMQHLPPIMINALHNAILRQNNINDRNISASVYPLPYVSAPGGFDPGQFTSAMFIGMLFVLAPAGLVVEIVQDREIMAKNLLRVNGLSFGLYFGSFFIVLGSMMLTTAILILLLIIAFQLKALITVSSFTLVAILYILYCPVGLLFGSCASYMFNKMESAQSIFPNASTFIGFVPYIIIFLCDVFKVGGSSDISNVLHYVFTFIDPLYIPYAILYYVNRVYFQCWITSGGGIAGIGDDSTLKCDNLPFSEYMTPEIIVILVALIIQIPFFFVLLLIVDVKKSGGLAADAFPFLKKSSKNFIENGEGAEYEGKGDSDVRSERSRIRNILSSVRNVAESPVIIVNNLRKKYRRVENDGNSCTGKKQEKVKVNTAVNSVSFAVNSGEVFGLLGHNGAGKTTTMKVITAEEAPTSGTVKVAGHDITSNISEAFQALGYCPQHDALWRNITVREHMETYATIRGVQSKDIPRMVTAYLKGLQIEEHANKYAKSCSGGTRRKLSYALAMLGRPAIVLMDEPSTGMDPQSKRFLWNTIAASFQGERGAILTTHSMEEADALCSRIGIMVKGELRCLGTSQHLKNIYGSGYVLEVKLKAAENGEVRDQRKASLTSFVSSVFPSAKIQESFEDRLIFAISQDGLVSLAFTFDTLEKARDKLHIEEYSFSQTTLEQVFIRFAREQEEEDES